MFRKKISAATCHTNIVIGVAKIGELPQSINLANVIIYLLYNNK